MEDTRSASRKPGRTRRSWMYVVFICLFVVVAVLLALFLGTDVLSKTRNRAPSPAQSDGLENETGLSPGAQNMPPGPGAGPDSPATTDLQCGRGNTWTKLGNMPMRLGEVSAGLLELDGKKYIVVIGENNKDDTEHIGESVIYDVESQVWKFGAARGSIGNHHASEVVNNELYVFGGFGGGSEDKVQIGSLSLIDGIVDIAWRYGSPLLYPTGSGNSALIDGKVYFCGGVSVPIGYKGPLADLETTTNCAVYTPNALGGSWSASVAKMPFGRNHAAACTDGGRMLVFGGRSGGNELGPGFAETQIYEPVTNTWTASNGLNGPAPLPIARGGMGKASFVAGKCFVMGGEDYYGTGKPDPVVGLSKDLVYNRVDIYDVVGNSWSAGAPLPFGMHGIQPVVDGCNVHICAGGLVMGYGQSDQHLMYTV